jgi:hypothetical protein
MTMLTNFVKKTNKKWGDIMATMADTVFIVKEDKVNQFLDIIKKPMISKSFLKKCKKANDKFKDSKK